MSTTYRVVVVTCCLAAAAGCLRSSTAAMGIPLREHTRFEAEWRRYQELESPKALAVAGDPAGVYVSGVATGGASQDSVNDDALSACQQRRVDRHIEAPCRLYAIGNEPLASGPADPS